MDKALVPRLLERGMIDRAYPLVRNFAPDVTLERWNRFARPRIASWSPNWPRGLMTIQNTTGYILGMFGFEVGDDLYENRILYIDNIIVPNLPGRDLIWASAIEAVGHLASMNGCRAIRARLTGNLDSSDSDRAWVVASLEKSGYSLDDLRTVKRLQNAPPGGDIRESRRATHGCTPDR